MGIWITHEIWTYGPNFIRNACFREGPFGNSESRTGLARNPINRVPSANKEASGGNSRLSETVLKKLKAVLSLDRSILEASKQYKPFEPQINLIMWFADMCTLNELSISLSRVTRYFSVTRFKDKMFPSESGLYHTVKSRTFLFGEYLDILGV